MAEPKIRGFIMYIFDNEETYEVLFYAHSLLEANGYAIRWAWLHLDHDSDWEVRFKEEK